MPPRRTSHDPEGYYDRLGVGPSATRTDIVAAYRAKARVLHPDVPDTGDAAAFVAVKQAYDVLADQSQREIYDRDAQQAAHRARTPGVVIIRRQRPFMAAGPDRYPRFPDVPVKVWVAVGAFLCLCLYEVTTRLLAPAPVVVRSDIRPNAQVVQPLSPGAHRAMLYGPPPVRLAGTPNFYVIPAGSPAVLWRMDNERNLLVSLGQLPPFSAVQAVRLIRQTGMLEVLVNDQGNGFVSADHLTPGTALAARSAYCSYNAGPTPFDGEQLDRQGTGNARLVLDSRAVQPAVVKLRNAAGAVALTVFLAPGGHAEIAGLPEGRFHPEFATGELWSRACNGFAAGMRAHRMARGVNLPADGHLIVGSEAEEPGMADISDQAFERN